MSCKISLSFRWYLHQRFMTTFSHLDSDNGSHLPLEFVCSFLLWVVGLMHLTLAGYFYCFICFPGRVLPSFFSFLSHISYYLLLLKWRQASTKGIVSSTALLWMRNEFLFPSLLLRDSPSVANTTARLVAGIWGKIRFPGKPHFKPNFGPSSHTNIKTHMYTHKQGRICTFLPHHQPKNKF